MVGAARALLLTTIAELKEKLEDPFLATNPLTEMLKGEVASMEAAIEQIDQNHGTTPGMLYSHLVQHEAYNSSGSGVTNTIRRRGAVAAHVRWADDDPRSTTAESQEQGIQSPMTPGIQRSVAAAMRDLSQE
jgi:hypothetical protein